MDNEQNKERFQVHTAAEALNDADPALVVIEGGEIGFVGQDYWIELDRIKTPRDLVEWIHHLLGKTWVTTDLLEQFVEKVYAYRHWTLYKDI